MKFAIQLLAKYNLNGFEISAHLQNASENTIIFLESNHRGLKYRLSTKLWDFFVFKVSKVKLI